MIVSTFGFAGSPGSPCFVRVELRLERGILFRISGISNQAARASATRIRSALMACGHRWPGKAITVNLAPADLSRTSTAFDLPIALAVLASSGIIPSSSLKHIAAAGEMGLDGTLRPWATSVFGFVETFSSELSDVRNIKTLLAPSKFDSSDSPLPLQLFTHLSEVIAYLKSPNKTQVKPHLIENPFNSIGNTSSFLEEVTFDIIKGEETAKRMAVIAAAGSHDVIMQGPPGTGKTVLAKCIHALLPDLSEKEFSQCKSIHSAAGLFLKSNRNRPPWLSPHTSTNMNGLIGSWSNLKGRGAIPGAWSLAHNGILFLDEFAEFSRGTLEACRAPLESKMISLARAAGSTTLPASALLIAAMNTCPCGRGNGDNASCDCQSNEIRRYRRKISGPIADRIAIHLELGHEIDDSIENGTKNISWTEAKSAVARVKKWVDNNPGEEKFVNGPPLTEEAAELLNSCRSVLKLSHRGMYHVHDVAITAALIDDSPLIEVKHIAEAGASRLFDRQSWMNPR